jgi:hypothetical protein
MFEGILQGVRDFAIPYFPDVCAVEYDAGGQGDDAGAVTDWQELHSGVPCMEDPGTGSETVELGKVSGTNISFWLMPAVLGDGSLNQISNAHRFTVAAREPFAERTLWVKNVTPYASTLLMVTAVSKV